MKNGNDARLVLSQDRKYTELEYVEPTGSDRLGSDPTQQETAETTKSNQREASRKRHVGAWVGAAVLIGLAIGAAHFGPNVIPDTKTPATAAHAAPVPSVVVSAPVMKDVEPQLQFLGQFSAVDRVDLRAQVGGTLTSIGFKDGDVVKQGDLLFQIDPTPTKSN